MRRPMRRRFRRAATLRRTAMALALSICGFAACAQAADAASLVLPPPQPSLSVAQIVARNVAARGGLAAWRRIRTMAWVGHIESAHAPMPSMMFTLEQERPNKTRFEINALGQTTIRVFDGNHGWKLRAAPNGGPDLQSYSPEELKFAEAAPGLDGPLIDYHAKGSVITLGGIDRVYGRRAYRLDVALRSGENDHVWVDARTFLELRYDRTSFSQAAMPVTVSMYYHDYKTIEGLRIPSVIETGVGSGKEPDRIVIERILLNPHLDARTFAMPDAPLPVQRSVRR